MNPADFPVLFVSLGSATLPLSTVNEYGDITIGADAVADSGRRAGADLRRAEIRRPRPGRSGSRRRARAVARRHPHRGVTRQFVDAGRHAERAEAGRHPAGLRPDGQGGRLQQGRGGLAQRLAGQARRGRDDLSTASRTTRSRPGSTASARSCSRSRSSPTPIRSRWSMRCWRSCRRCGRRFRPRSRCRRADGPLDLDPSGGGRRRGDAADRGRARHPGDLPVPALGVGDLHSGAGGADLAARHLRGDVRARLSPSTT